MNKSKHTYISPYTYIPPPCEPTNRLFLGLITRCKDEFFINEFCNYYLQQGVDQIYIIDDNSKNKNIYKGIKNKKIKIIYSNNIIKNNYSSKLYKSVRNYFEWMIYCDVDEFITTKYNIHLTIREELLTTFKNIDCIHVPWVMMSCNRQVKNPKILLDNNVYRWNHNLKHFHPLKKFRCRYNYIETKSIFKCSKFNDIWEHSPFQSTHNNLLGVDSINLKPSGIYYKNLRENNIENGYLLCYHYRMISIENCINKLTNNIWYKNSYTLNDLLLSDHAEIIDKTLKYKYLSLNNKFKVIFIHIGKCGGSFIENSFSKNLNSLHMSKPKLNNNNNNKYIICIRNPIERFISAFYHSKILIDFNCKGYTYEKLLNDRTTPFYQLKNKISNKLKHNNPFLEWKRGDEYKDLICSFESANHLAESISSSDLNIQKKAKALCNNEEVEHIYKGIGWYLHNGDFIDKNWKNIIYCEDINDINLKHISILTNLPIQKNNIYSRKNNIKYNKYLSPLAIQNIKEFYKNSDYKALNKLLKYNLISKKIFDSYHTYSHS